MYHFWRQNPLFRPALGFMIGIYLQDSLALGDAVLLSLFVILIIWQIITEFRGYQRVTLAPFLWFVALGLGFHSLQPEPEKIQSSPNFYLAEIQSSPKSTEKYSNYDARLLGFNQGPNHQVKIKIALLKDSLAEKLLPGDCILLYGSLFRVKGPANPFGFDYAQYLGRKGIFHQIYVREKAWTKTGHKPGIIRQAHIWRNWALSAISESIHHEESAGILKALLCGDTRDLDPEVRESYAQSGTMHILAVSGMHVGILLLIIKILLGNGRYPVIRNFIILLILWLYALITGLSPSVMRAVSMASFYLVGEIFSREHSTWNSVAFALLALLILDTHNLYNPGFQLSFLALCGILSINGKRSYNTTLKGKIINWLKSFFMVSVAAQAATSPIAIYYFDQFPVYFLLGNLLIVPLAAPIMYMGLLLLLAYSLDLFWEQVAILLEKLLNLCHMLAHHIAQLPGAKLGGLDWDIGLVACAYLLLLGLVMYRKTKSTDLLFLGTICFIFWIMYDNFTYLNRKQQEGVLVYSLNKKVYLDYYKGSSFFALGDTLESRDSLNMLVFRKRKNLVDEVKPKTNEFEWGQEISTPNLRIIRYKGNKTCEFPENEIPCVLILEQYSSGNLKRLHDSLKFCNIVLASNLGWNAREKWKRQAQELGIPIHDLREEGAYHKEIWNHSFITKLKIGLGTLP